jgi:hypothetical protein
MFKKFTAFDQIPADRQKDALKLEDGSFAIDVDSDEITTLRTSVTKLEGTLEKVRGEKSAAEKAKKDAEDAAANVQRELEARQAGGQLTDAKVKELLDKWEVEKQKAIAAAVEEATKPLGSMQERLTKYELDDVLGSEFIKAGGTEKRRAQAVALAKLNGFQLVDGKVVRKVSGEIQTTSVTDYFGGEFKTEMQEWYDGTKASGGGAGGGTGGGAPAGGGTGGTKPPTEWSSDERRTFIETNGQDAYRKLLNDQLVAAATPKAK